MRTVVMSLVIGVYLACGSDGTDLHKRWTREVIAGTPHAARVVPTEDCPDPLKCER
jgi:hypothetical protein